VEHRLPHLTPSNPDYVDLVKKELLQQGFMHLLGVKVTDVEPGFVELRVKFRPELAQQHGFFHGGLVGTLADNCIGGSSITMLPPGHSVLTVEYKINLLSPAKGDELIAQGFVIKPGKNLIVTRADVFAESNGKRKLVATALGSVYVIKRSDYTFPGYQAPTKRMDE